MPAGSPVVALKRMRQRAGREEDMGSVVEVRETSDVDEGSGEGAKAMVASSFSSVASTLSSACS